MAEREGWERGLRRTFVDQSPFGRRALFVIASAGYIGICLLVSYLRKTAASHFRLPTRYLPGAPVTVDVDRFQAMPVEQNSVLDNTG